MIAQRPRVVIVGAGFGGINAARRLGDEAVDVLLVDRHNYHLFQPLLYQVATAGLEPGEIAYPVRRILHRFANVEFRMADVRAVQPERHCLITDDGEIGYDWLVLATGSESNFFGMERLAERSHALKDVDDAVELRNHILSCFERAVALPKEERGPLLTFAISGGGPTGVEFAGALSELVSVVVRRDYRTITPGEVHVVLVEGESRLLASMHPRLGRSALHELRRRGVQVITGARISDYDGQFVRMSTGASLEAATLVWAAGVHASSLGGTLGLTLARGRRIPIQPTLQVEGHPDVYVIGDLAHLEEGGNALPQLAPVAIQQGQLVAENIIRRVQGLPPRPFHYFDKGTLATIGRRAAVADFGSLRLTGELAWFMWLAVHLVQLIGFRNRLAVLLDWGWNYLRFDSAIRLITRQ
ncbi:MAG TPA: NAD(P)/FAD-dependent oxidoreductase [Chloroflexota bacterium]|nr:NAD(P)/FAD-dependent oxidoreductase [Chloroflexota bacterium]